MLDRLLDISTNFGVDTLLLLPVLIALEAVLSADNAIALAAIAQGLETEKQQQQALNIGLVAAFVLRMTLILTATWVLRFWQFEVAGAVYLLWLVFQHFTAPEDAEHHHHGPRFATVWQAIPTIALADLAFSLDSVTTAIALSQDVLVVLLGGTIGIITLRFMAQLFIRWLDVYEYLEDAGFITVALVGIRLLVRVVNENWVPPQWLMISLIAAIFIWGFSKKTDSALMAQAAESDPPLEPAASAEAVTSTTETAQSHHIEEHDNSSGHPSLQTTGVARLNHESETPSEV
jgi:YkoY family integral membrane protein